MRPQLRVLQALAAALALVGCRSEAITSGPDAPLRGTYMLSSVAGEAVPTASAPDGMYRVREGELTFGPANRVLRRVWYVPADPASPDPLLLRLHEGTFERQADGLLRLTLVDPVSASEFPWRPEAALEASGAGGAVESVLLRYAYAAGGTVIVERYTRRAAVRFP